MFALFKIEIMLSEKCEVSIESIKIGFFGIMYGGLPMGHLVQRRLCVTKLLGIRNSYTDRHQVFQRL